jgi:hypothetical protein
MFITAKLHEQYPASGKPRVDREAGVIFGVKVVGRSSPNSHGVKNPETGKLVEGTDYEELALKNALQKYQEAVSNIDHGDKKGGERSALSRFGMLKNVQFLESGIFGDYHFFDPKDPLAVRMMNSAESFDGKGFALSHNATGRGEVIGNRYVVKEITEVASVDVVADGGTNATLFENREPPMKIKFKEAGKKYAKLAPFVRLFESGGSVGARLLEAEGEDTGDYRDHLHMAKKMCEDAGDSEMATKIHALAKPKGKDDTDTDAPDEGEVTPTPEDTMEDEEITRPAGMKGGKTPDDKADKVKESRQRTRSKDPHVVALQERLDKADLKEWIRQECERKDMPCDEPLLDTMMQLREHKRISNHLDYLKSKGVKAVKSRQAPRAVAPFDTRTLHESREGRPASSREEFLSQIGVPVRRGA